MKQLTKGFGIKAFTATAILCLLSVLSWAQDQTVKINGENIGSWLSHNWMWVAGGVILLLLLIGVLSGGSRRSRTPVTKKTTIVREEDASGVVRTTTTEIKE